MNPLSKVGHFPPQQWSIWLIQGNPFTDFKEWKNVTIHEVPQLKKINGTEILASDRIRAAQKHQTNLQALETFVNTRVYEGYSKEKRLEDFREDVAHREAKEARDKAKFPGDYKGPPKQSSKFFKNGERRMCNEFKAMWSLIEDKEARFSELRVQLPRGLDTEDIQVEISGMWVAIRVKLRLFQMKLWNEVFDQAVKLQRSKTTGELFIRMKKVKPCVLMLRREELQQEKIDKEMKEKSKHICL